MTTRNTPAEKAEEQALADKAAAEQKAADEQAAAAKAEEDRLAAEKAATEASVAADKAADEARAAAEDKGPAPEIGSPAWRRQDRIRALEEELEGYKRTGKDDRAKAVEAELKEARKAAPKGRTTPKTDKA